MILIIAFCIYSALIFLTLRFFRLVHSWDEEVGLMLRRRNERKKVNKRARKRMRGGRLREVPREVSIV